MSKLSKNCKKYRQTRGKETGDDKITEVIVGKETRVWYIRLS